jgi:hypothetical protein
MKYLSLALVFAFSFSAFATTNSIIAKGETKGTVLIIGSPTDHEAWRFYETLTVEVKELNGKYTKVFNYLNAAGEKVLSASCVFSKMFKENGTCTITIYPFAGVTIDSSSGLIEYISPDASEAQRLAAGFEAPDANGLVYANDNGRFTVHAGLKDGAIESFTLTYK